MASAYSSPGVQVELITSPAIAPNSPVPDIIAIVGTASGLQAASENAILTGTNPYTIAHTGVITASVAVKNTASGLTVNPGAYVVALSSDPDGTTTDGDEVYTLTRFATPSAGPTVNSGGTGALTGTYHYAVSFVNAAGETGIGPQSADSTVATGGFNLSNIPLGPTGTTARNIYREKVVSSVGQGFHLVATLADNTTIVLNNEATDDTTAGSNPAPVQGITSGDTVTVSYNYADNKYYQPTLFSDWGDIVAKYGQPFDTNGNINSNLSFAARMAILNGAQELYLVASKSTGNTDMTAAFTSLEAVPGVTFVLVADGTAANHTLASAHCAKMIGQGLFRSTIVGRDGSATAITEATLQAAAEGFNAEYVQLVSPASFQIQNPVTLRPLNVGGQWVAAALAGMKVARDPQFPLTRKNVAGFSAINDVRTESQKKLDSAAGLCVIEDKGGVLRVRHDVTTAIGDINSAESSIVRVKYQMALRLNEALDGLVGSVVALQRAPYVVVSAISAILEQMIIEGAISGYGNLTARTLQTSPTTVNATFSYAPAYPINNIVVDISIDTQAGTVDITTQ